MRISVIVPTYNRPEALELSIRSLALQSMLPQEVLIADDGSGPETASVVQKMSAELNRKFPVRHIWQEDIGFRKPRILNETVRQSAGDYLVFLDGDCMAHRNFIEEHIRASSPERILSGKRVEIGKELTEKLIGGGQVINRFTLDLLWDAMLGSKPRTRKVEEAVLLRSPVLRKMLHRDAITDDGVWGCNFSVSRELFYRINGCDEDFVDGSIEDNDLGIRVLNLGKELRSVRGLAIIFHLWHRTTWSFENEKYQHNVAILRRRIENKESRCRNGIVRT